MAGAVCLLCPSHLAQGHVCFSCRSGFLLFHVFSWNLRRNFSISFLLGQSFLFTSLLLLCQFSLVQRVSPVMKRMLKTCSKSDFQFGFFLWRIFFADWKYWQKKEILELLFKKMTQNEIQISLKGTWNVRTVREFSFLFSTNYGFRESLFLNLTWEQPHEKFDVLYHCFFYQPDNDKTQRRNLTFLRGFVGSWMEERRLYGGWWVWAKALVPFPIWGRLLQLCSISLKKK